jgi:hypothetical protein
VRSIQALCFLVLVSSGCQSLGSAKMYPLTEVWRPLEGIKENKALVGVVTPDSSAVTIGRYVNVNDVEKWIATHPPTGVIFRSKMRHEQEHARRQMAKGVFSWICVYSYDKEFALFEEKIGWYWEIKTLTLAGITINRHGIAKILSGYANLAGQLISLTDARTWVDEVLSGMWTPPPS